MSETLADIYDEIRADPAFAHFRNGHTVVVPGEGALRPKVFIVGDAPGAAENTAVRPFYGAAGHVLRSLVTDVARLDPADYFLTNAVKYWPGGLRTPVPYEVQISVPYLRREWRAVGSPSVIVAVGGVAKAALAPKLDRVERSAGRPHMLGPDRFVWPMIHPAKALSNPDFRPLIENHWDAFGEWMREVWK